MTLPSASSTACDVKFSEGIKFMKCFCRLFSWSWRQLRPVRSNHMAYSLDDFEDFWIALCEVIRQEPMLSIVRHAPRSIVHAQAFRTASDNAASRLHEQTRVSFH